MFPMTRLPLRGGLFAAALLVPALLAAPVLAQDAAPVPMPAPAPDGLVQATSAPVNLMQASAPAVQPGDAAPASNPRQALQRVNAYFNSMRVLSGDFVQTAPDGSRSKGKFFISKPGKLRFFYERPSTTDIIADGKTLAVRDRKLNTQDIYPLSQTPLRFLLQPNLDLTRDAHVVAVNQTAQWIGVTIEERSKIAGTSRLALIFDTDGANTTLRQWTVTDAQGLQTTVALSNIDTRSVPKDSLFTIDFTRDIAGRRR